MLFKREQPPKKELTPEEKKELAAKEDARIRRGSLGAAAGLTVAGTIGLGFHGHGPLGGLQESADDSQKPPRTIAETAPDTQAANKEMLAQAGVRQENGVWKVTAAQESPHTQRVNFAELGLAGKDLGALGNILFTGKDARIPDIMTVDPSKHLEELWVMKRQWEESHPDGLQGGSALGPKVVEHYRYLYERGLVDRMDFGQAEFVINRGLQRLKANLDWDKLQKLYGLSNKSVATAVDLLNRIDGSMLLTRSIGEICSVAGSGEMNAKACETLLKEYGGAFLAGIAAVYDGNKSMGPGQLTQEWVFGKDREGRPKGVSKINEALEGYEKLPNELSPEMTYEQHMLAMAAFDLNNILTLLGSIDHTVEKIRNGEKGESWRIRLHQNLLKAEKEELSEMLASIYHQGTKGTNAVFSALEKGSISDESLRKIWASANKRSGLNAAYAEKIEINGPAVDEILAAVAEAVDESDLEQAPQKSTSLQRDDTAT